MSGVDKPRYRHNCDGCIFLGRYRKRDLYYCPKSEPDVGGSFLARFGNEPDAFGSMARDVLEDAMKHSPTIWDDGHALVTALRVAKARGLASK